MTDHVVTHRIQESPDDNGKTSANITSYLREAIIKKNLQNFGKVRITNLEL